MTREQKYVQQLQALGVYNEAFQPEIHMLAEMERDLQRARKDWIAAGRSIDSDLYEAIERLRRDILSHRQALGLTPAGLRRVRGRAIEPPEEEDEKAPTVLDLVRKRAGA